MCGGLGDLERLRRGPRDEVREVREEARPARRILSLQQTSDMVVES